MKGKIANIKNNLFYILKKKNVPKIITFIKNSFMFRNQSGQTILSSDKSNTLTFKRSSRPPVTVSGEKMCHKEEFHY